MFFLKGRSKGYLFSLFRFSIVLEFLVGGSWLEKDIESIWFVKKWNCVLVCRDVFEGLGV